MKKTVLDFARNLRSASNVSVCRDCNNKQTRAKDEARKRGGGAGQ